MNRIKNIREVLILTLIVVIFLQIRIFAAEIPSDEFKNVTAPNVLLADTNTGKILYEKNIDERIYPASITKLMTAILVVENCNLDDIVTISENAVRSVPVGYVNANLQIGEELTVNDLMHVMLIPSANDAANALAEYVGGSIESFATMMNTRAKELGCTGTNFTNPSGLHEEEHYTTARDLLLIAKQAISNDTIKKIVGKTNYTLPKTNKYTGASRMFTTTNYMKRQSLTKYYCDYCIGGKTGYTGDAGNCVIEFAKKDGIELIAIVMGEDAKVKGKKFLDAKEILDYVYKNYESKSVVKKNEKYETIKIFNATKDTKMLDVLYKDNVNILNNKNNEINIENIKKAEYYKTNAPIQKGDVIGKITYEYDGIKYETELIAGTNAEKSTVLERIFYLFLIVLIIYIIYSYKKSNKKARKNKRSKKRKAKRIYY